MIQLRPPAPVKREPSPLPTMELDNVDFPDMDYDPPADQPPSKEPTQQGHQTREPPHHVHELQEEVKEEEMEDESAVDV